MTSEHTWYELFRQCASYGLTPSQVLDMNIGQVQAFIDGKSDEYTRQQCLLVEAGYWNRIFVMGKKPKSPDFYIRKIMRSKQKLEEAENAGRAAATAKDEPDVAKFLEMDRRFANAPTLIKE